MQLNEDILNTNLLSKEKRNTDIQNTLSLPFRSPNPSPFDGKTVPQLEWKRTDKSYQRKNKFRSKHRKRVPFSVNLPARITCRKDLLVGKYPKVWEMPCTI